MKRISCIILTLLLLAAMIVPCAAHSGRTDANGGHRDNKNVSGLGSYHYHCGGYPAHLHPNGVCPYRTSATPSAGSTASSGSASSSGSSGATAPASTAGAADQSQMALAKAAITEARNAGQATAALTFDKGVTLTAETLKEMASAASNAGVSLKVQYELRENGSLRLRMSLFPADTTGTFKLGLADDPEEALNIAGRFQGLYGGNVTAIPMLQQGDFGLPVTVVYKIQSDGFDASSLAAYTYDTTANRYKQVAEDQCRVDENNFAYITISQGGYLLITDRAF